MKQTIKCYSIVALGSLIFGLAFDWFFAPNLIAMGGVTGLAQVLNVLLPWASLGVLSFLLNVPLFLAGWHYIGFHLLATSLFSMVVSSAAIDVFAAIWTFPPMDPMLATIFGGAVMGVGFGAVFSQGATTGGVDIIARLLALKYPWLPLGKLLLIPDAIVLMLVAITFGQVETALYGAVGMFIATWVMDAVLYGLDTSKVAYVITDRWQEIAEMLMREQDRGVTYLYGEGAYTGQEKRVLLVAFKQKDIVELKRSVHSMDPQAFMIVCNTHEVLGEGFAEYQKENG